MAAVGSLSSCAGACTNSQAFLKGMNHFWKTLPAPWRVQDPAQKVHERRMMSKQRKGSPVRHGATGFGPATFGKMDALAAVVIAVLAVLISLRGLGSNGIDGLDSAHHLLDGYFFRDLIVDHPFRTLPHYTLSYYKQYPALGFIFWPPLFPFFEGLFDLVGGAHVLTSRICLLCFGMLFGIGFFAALRRNLPTGIAFAAACAAMAVPGLSRSFNELMLELPTLAVMCVAVLLYLRMVNGLGQPHSMRRAVLCGVACAAVVYTKQPGWFLYGALLFDFVLRYRRVPGSRVVWATMATIFVLCLPLAVFMLKFGHADLAQSVGSNTKLIMKNYDALPRWSWGAWTFYPRLAPSLLNPVVLVLGLCGLALAVVKRSFLRSNALWVGWFALAYLTFSFYDNRLPRHASFWWPAWIALAAAALEWIRERTPPRVAMALPILLLLYIPAEAWAAYHANYSDFEGERQAASSIFANGSQGNVMLIGADKQLFVALIREMDTSRKVHIVRGNDLLQDATPASLCYRYRIGTVLLDRPASDGAPDKMWQTSDFHQTGQSTILRNGVPYTVTVLRYSGPMSATMEDVPLSKRLL